MNGMCTDCPHRTLCHSLCPEAEIYANQDEVRLREKTIGLPMYAARDWPGSHQNKSPFTKREIEVLTHLGKGETRSQIAQVLGITRGTVRSIIRNLRKKRAQTRLETEE